MENPNGIDLSGVENPEAFATTGKSKAIEKGNERYDKLTSFLGKATASTGELFKKGKAGIGRMFKGAAVGVLAAPDLAKQGIENTGKAIDRGADYVFNKADQFDAWRDQSAEKISKWGETKKQQLSDFGNEKSMMVGLIASLAKNRTAEGLQSAKESIGNRFQKITEYGKNAIANAQMRRGERTDRRRNELYFLQYMDLKEKKDSQEAKLAKTKAKMDELAQFFSFTMVGESSKKEGREVPLRNTNEENLAIAA